jgi:hypothetical protein
MSSACAEWPAMASKATTIKKDQAREIAERFMFHSFQLCAEFVRINTHDAL